MFGAQFRIPSSQYLWKKYIQYEVCIAIFLTVWFDKEVAGYNLLWALKEEKLQEKQSEYVDIGWACNGGSD